MEKDKKNLYLEEDFDLLGEVASAGLNDNKKLSEVHIKAVLRNRKSLENLDSSTTRYSKILIWLGFIQIVIILFQIANEYCKDLLNDYPRTRMVISLAALSIFVYMIFISKKQILDK